MGLTNTEVMAMTVGLFKQESDRDKQRKVGASQISDPCTKHLAKALLAEPEPQQKYWMGAKIGTAIHSFLESAISTDSTGLFDNALVEQKISLGNVSGYGSISSKPDLVLPTHKHLIDWKTSSRTKVKKLKDLVDGVKHDSGAEYTLKKYIGQTQLYAWGMNQTDIKVDSISLVFINREGTYENDIWTHTYEYDESFAVALWNRLIRLWDELQSGAHPDNYPSNPECFKCNIGI
jgi:hypothetical protein